MKKLFLMFTGMLLACASADAAIARTYPDALAKTGKNPIVIFIYGANYDKVSQRTYEEFVKKNKISPFVRQATFLEMPLYQLPNDREKKDMEKRLGVSACLVVSAVTPVWLWWMREETCAQQYRAPTR